MILAAALMKSEAKSDLRGLSSIETHVRTFPAIPAVELAVVRNAFGVPHLLSLDYVGAEES